MLNNIKELSSPCKYHVVWCPKYRRKLLINDVEARLKELISDTCSKIKVDIIEMEIMPDHVHLLLEVDPQYGIHKAVKQIKGTTSKVLRNEFTHLTTKLPTLWSNSYFVSTVGGAPLEAIKQYVLSQKTSQIAVEATEQECTGWKTMGIDLGLKIPAVAVTESGKVKFFGNGRQNKYMKRMFRSRCKTLGQKKKLSAIKNLDNKEQRWMKDKDHKISRQIVNFALDNKVAVIKLEQLSGIRQTARTSRKNEKNLHSWSFYRLAQFIEYKAILAGIKVEYVNPKNTSKKCPECETLNTAKDRKYLCVCGFKSHRDIVGARNIISAPVAVGNRMSA